MSLVNFVVKRAISTTAVREGKRNFKKFPVYNKRGDRYFKKKQMVDPYPDVPVHTRGVRPVGYQDGDKFVRVPEMIPELIVPDLKDFQLKPYVSYRAADIVQSEFTAKDLFNVVYAPKIKEDLKNDKLNEDGSPMEPSNEEKQSPDQAKLRDKQTGSDIF